MCLRIREGAKVLFDAHEFYLEDISGGTVKKRIYRNYAYYLLNSLLKKVNSFTTVSAGFSAAYHSIFGLKPVVIPNVPFYINLQPTPVSAERIRLVHVGAAQPDRNIDKMIEAVGKLGQGFELKLYLLPSDPKYYAYLRKLSLRHENVFFNDPIPYDEVISTINSNDIGIYILRPTSSQTLINLPNKIFEFIQARLAVLIGPHPEMGALVEKYNLGKIAPGYEVRDIQEALLSATREEIYQYKLNSDKAAKELCAENYKETFLKLLD